MRRRAFTLIEVMVALVVTGLVVSVAYATVQAGLDTTERLSAAQDGEERETIARDLVTNALRHATPGIIGGEPVFVLVDDPNGDALRFRTRGISEPLGASEEWDVSLESSASGVQLTGRSGTQPTQSFTTSLGRVRALEIRVMSRDVRDGWLVSWPAPDRSPVAVSIQLLDADRRVVGPALVSRIGLEGSR